MKFRVSYSYSVEGETIIEANSEEEARDIAGDQYINGTIGDELGEEQYDFNILDVEEEDVEEETDEV